MAYVVKITPSALRDLKNGVAYYNSVQKGLGKKFAVAIANRIEQIRQMPDAASVAYDHVR